MLLRGTFWAAALLTASVGARASSVTVDFEELPDSTILTTQYPGLTFTNAVILTAGISLNEFEFPPNSGVNVASDNGGPMSIGFNNPTTSFSAYFTYLEPLTVDAFDVGNNLVASALSLFSTNLGCVAGPPCSGDPGSSPNEFIQVSFTSGISSITITGDPAGGSFTMDDAMYTTAVPESSSFLSWLIGTAGLFILCSRKQIIMTKQRVLIGVGSVALIILSGAWLYAQQTTAPDQETIHVAPPLRSGSPAASGTVASQTLARATDSSQATPNTISLLPATSSHTIGQITLSPNLVTAGASQSITLTATITDPNLIASSVDAVYSRLGLTGTTVLGPLVVSGDNTYRIVFALPPSVSPGEIDLQITAAFRGVLIRAKSLPIPLYINPPGATIGWTTLSDSQDLFTVEVPTGWNVHPVETLGPDSLLIKSVQFVLTDGVTLFSIDVFTPTQWQALQNGITPLLIGQSAQYIFGLTQAQDISDTNALTQDQILSQLPAIYSTFRVR